jgi:hypothetical protein
MRSSQPLDALGDAKEARTNGSSFNAADDGCPYAPQTANDLSRDTLCALHGDPTVSKVRENLCWYPSPGPLWLRCAVASRCIVSLHASAHMTRVGHENGEHSWSHSSLVQLSESYAPPEDSRPATADARLGPVRQDAVRGQESPVHQRSSGTRRRRFRRTTAAGPSPVLPRPL